MKTKVELLEEIVKKQDERMKFMEELFDLYDESEIIDNSYTTYYSIKNKLKLNNIEITDLKSRLSEAGEKKKQERMCLNCALAYKPTLTKPCVTCDIKIHSNWQPR